jgi:hypothetical protein
VAYSSAPELLTLHAVRIKGMTDSYAISRRFALDRGMVQALLLDYEAYGWVQHVEFADVSGWALTNAGRDEDNRRLAAELEAAQAREAVVRSHAAFVPLNTRFLEAMTKWQVRPTPWDSMAAHDHSDWRWDERVLESLSSLLRKLRPIGEQLAEALTRFVGYPDRFAAAVDRVNQGQRTYVDEPKIDSCHTVWFELHEDLLSTLGLERSSETATRTD